MTDLSLVMIIITFTCGNSSLLLKDVLSERTYVKFFEEEFLIYLQAQSAGRQTVKTAE